MKYLGIDFGLRRVGLATSEGELASPFKTVEVKGLKDAVEKVSGLIKIERFDYVVVGLPEGKMGKNAVGFGKALIKKGIKVEFADETLTSKIALDQMIHLNIPQKKRRFNDELAAAIILQRFLDSQ